MVTINIMIIMFFVALCQASEMLLEDDDLFVPVIMDTRVYDENVRGARSGCSSACVFPFDYDGETYWECTAVDDSQLWCGTGVNGDGTLSWIYCDEDCSDDSAKQYPCPNGYVLIDGDIAGWGQIEGAIRTTMAECSNRCNQNVDCCSLEYDFTTGYCNLNSDCLPNLPKNMDQHFCTKDGLLLLSSDGEAGSYHGEGEMGMMGLYSRMEGVTHNNKPVWIRDLNNVKLFYSGNWFFEITNKKNPESEDGDIASVLEGLASPLLGVKSGWEYHDGDEWQTDELLSVKAITLPTYPEEVTVSSNGPAKERVSNTMGVYTMTRARQHMRPVWQKVQDNNSLFLFYADNGLWLISDELTDRGGWIKSGRYGLPHLPEGGWVYGFERTWFTDDTTLTIANTVSG